jgi:outer membrane protein insertion porin family
MHSYRGFLLMLVSGIVLLASVISVPRSTFAQQNQRLVESVDVINTRRLRKDDILYYVQTRPGDPYNEQQVQRDLQAILALGFFDKTKTKVLTAEGARGGIDVIFDVTELPIIRDLQFEGLKSVPESDVL